MTEIDTAAPRQTGMFGALAYRYYRRTWSASFIYQVGSWMQITARAYIVYRLTGSTAALGLVYFFTYIPQLVISPFSGVLADRFDRRRLLIVIEIISTVGAAAMGVLVTTGTATLWSIIGVSFALGVVQALAGPAQNALLPALVGREALSSAVALDAAMMSASRIVGPLLAGLLLPLVGPAWLFYVNAICFAVLIGTWLSIRTPRQAPMEQTAPLRAIAEGVRFIRKTPTVSIPLVIVAISGVGLVYQPLGIPFTTHVLAHGYAHQGSRYYGYLQTGIGIGSVIGIMTLTSVFRRSVGWGLVITGVFFGAMLALLGSVTTIGPVIPIALGIGAFQFANSTIALTAVQHGVPEALRGRILSVFNIAWIGSFPLTSLASGAIADQVGIRATLMGTGCICLVASALLGGKAHLVENEGARTAVDLPIDPVATVRPRS